MAVGGAEHGAPVIVVKLGGDVLEEPALGKVSRDLREVAARGDARLAVVHGGGAQVTALAARLGHETRIVAGRRVTDAAALDVLAMVVAGRLGVELGAALHAEGVAAVGLHAGSGAVKARRRAPAPLAGAGPDTVDLGLVGDVTGFDRPLLEALWAAGRVPVLASIALGDGGAVFNVNADLVASQLAAAFRARALVAVTAVGGVRWDKDDPATRIARLTVTEAKRAIAAGRVQGGMIAKLEEAFAPLAAGVGSVQIVAPGEVAAGLAVPGSVGTVLVDA